MCLVNDAEQYCCVFVNKHNPVCDNNDNTNKTTLLLIRFIPSSEGILSVLSGINLPYNFQIFGIIWIIVLFFMWLSGIVDRINNHFF